MRDFRDAKAMAQTARAALAAKGLKITISESLELIAKAFGVTDWNTLSAAIKTADAEPDRSQDLASARPADASATRERPDAIPRAAGRVGFSAALEATLHRAVGLAAARKHELTLEHLLLALIEDANAAEAMRACKVDLGELAKTLTAFVDNELKSLAVGDGENPAPTSGFQRVIQRAVIHVQTSGRDEVTGANVLVAMFSERESDAASFLRQQGLNRYDAVNFIAHGIRKDGGQTA
jgi:hypothetical protein